MLWPSKMLVCCEFRFWGHPRWEKSIRGPWSAFAHANLCSKRLISHFGVSSHSQFCPKLISGGLGTSWPSQTLAYCEFWFWVQCLPVEEDHSGAQIKHLPKQNYAFWHFLCIVALQLPAKSLFWGYWCDVTLKNRRLLRGMTLSASKSGTGDRVD